jgi:hypothetical protein
MNQEQRNIWQKEHRKKTRNWDTKKYEKTPKGFLVRLYRNMQSRVTGVQKLKQHLYLGKSLLNRDDFYAWADSSLEFKKLFAEWELSNYTRTLTPSVDRIDSDLGYSLENMRWVTFSENCRNVRRKTT